MKQEIEHRRIDSIIPLETAFSLQRIKPEMQDPIRVIAQMSIMFGNPMLAYIVKPKEKPYKLQKIQSNVVNGIYQVREKIFRITTESGSEYILTIEDTQSVS